MLICNNKYISGSELQYTMDSLCVMGISWMFWIIACVARFLILFLPLLNVSCMSNIFPRLIKLAFLYKILLCRLLWLTDFFENQSPKGGICCKIHKILKKKKQIWCTYVAFFLLRYWTLANIGWKHGLSLSSIWPW